MIKRESKTFRFCAKNINNNNYIIADAIRFEGSENIIYAICYDDISNNIIKIPVYETSSSEKFEQTLCNIILCYRNDHNGIFVFC